MLTVKFKKLAKDVTLPVKGTEHAACYDVYCSSITFKDGKAIYGLGFATEIPVGYRGVLIPRSNLTKHRWVMNNNQGIIDSDYRGEWMMVFTPLEGELIENSLPYGTGERVGQIYFEQILDVEFKVVDSLEESERGSGGFGSTGLR